jgi:hypothetical protein
VPKCFTQKTPKAQRDAWLAPPIFNPDLRDFETISSAGTITGRFVEGVGFSEHA